MPETVMSHFIYNTAISLSGPWLLDIQKLRNLDTAISNEYNRLVTISKNQVSLSTTGIDNKSQNIITLSTRKAADVCSSHLDQNILPNVQKSITLILEDETKVKIESFEAAAKDSALKDSKPIAFEIKLQYEAVICEITLNTDEDGKLHIRCSPEDHQIAKELFEGFRHWAQMNTVSKIQGLWIENRWMAWPLLFIAFIVMLIALPNGNDPRTIIKGEIKELIKHGIHTEIDRNRAIELILMLQTDYTIGKKDNHLQKDSHTIHTMRNLFVLLLITAIIINRVPKSTIGIGRGESKVHHWHLWITTLKWLIVTGWGSTIIMHILQKNLFS